MNYADSVGVSRVQQRAKRSENSPKAKMAYDWDAEDAVPIRTHTPRKQQRNTTSTQTKARVQENSAAQSSGRSYRVRDAAYRAQQKANAKRTTAAEAEETVVKRPRTRTVPEDRRKSRGAPDSTHNTDSIFLGNASSDVQRLALRLRRGFQGKRTMLMVLTVMMLILLLALMVYKVFFVVTEIRIEGDSRYSREEIAEASGVENGANLFSFSSRIVADRVTLRLPYIRTLAVNRTIPDDVLFTVTEEKALFWTELYGEIWTVSPTLRLLEPVSRDEAQQQGWIRLRLPEVERAVAGRVLDFRDDRMFTWIWNVSSVLQESPLLSRITELDVRDSYNLRMVSDDCYLLLFGSDEDIAVQLRVASAVLSDTLFDSTVKAQIDLTASGSTSVIFDDQLKLD